MTLLFVWKRLAKLRDRRQIRIASGNFVSFETGNVTTYIQGTISITSTNLVGPYRKSNGNLQRTNFVGFLRLPIFGSMKKEHVAALSHHLRHYDLDMTRRYVTDTEFGRLWKDVQDGVASRVC